MGSGDGEVGRSRGRGRRRPAREWGGGRTLRPREGSGGGGSGLRNIFRNKRCRRAVAVAVVFRDLACGGRTEGEIEGHRADAGGERRGSAAGRPLVARVTTSASDSGRGYCSGPLPPPHRRYTGRGGPVEEARGGGWWVVKGGSHSGRGRQGAYVGAPGHEQQTTGVGLRRECRGASQVMGGRLAPSSAGTTACRFLRHVGPRNSLPCMVGGVLRVATQVGWQGRARESRSVAGEDG